MVKPLLLAALCIRAAIAADVFGWFPFQQQTKLVGSSFGVVGVNATYDYIIVGGGTAGLTIARRLSHLHTVAVIEGGSFYEFTNGNISQVPGYANQYTNDDPSSIQPFVDWGHLTTPQPQLNDRILHYTQGKCLGGSSSRNVLCYHRGTRGSYRQWADAVGDRSYTWDNIVKYFRKSVDFTPPDLAKRGFGEGVRYDRSAFSLGGGPLQVSYPNFVQPVTKFLRTGFSALGLKALPGLNSGDLVGFSDITTTVDPRAATRSSAESSMLQATIRDSYNVVVYLQTLADKILFDDDKRATGVRLKAAGKTYTLSARNEVILTAGAFRSPQMLMVSGIGPAATLKKLNIPVIQDLPGVGQNLKDQPYFGLVYQVNVTTGSTLQNTPAKAAAAVQQYLNNQTGPLSSLGVSVLGFSQVPQSLLKTLSPSTIRDMREFAADWPNFEHLNTGSNTVTAAKTAGDGKNYVTFSVAVLTATSRGNITINSTDTSLNPIVSPNWMLTKTDQELAVVGFKLARQLAKATGVTIGDEVAPGPSVRTDAQILSYLRGAVGSIHHAAGSNPMGRAGDPEAVVDSRGHVFGVKGLRVADVSTFPLLPPGHCQSSVYMLAEKLSDDILSGR